MGMDQGRIVDTGAAEALIIAVQDLVEAAVFGQADKEAVIADGREVGDTDHIAVILLGGTEEGDGTAAGIVHIQPLEAVPGAVHGVEGRGGAY